MIKSKVIMTIIGSVFVIMFVGSFAFDWYLVTHRPPAPDPIQGYVAEFHLKRFKVYVKPWEQHFSFYILLTGFGIAVVGAWILQLRNGRR